jgi:hypothetical protein
MTGDVAPARQTALLAEQLLKPLVAEGKYWVGGDHQPGAAGWHAALNQLLGSEQVQEVAAAAASQLLFRVGWAAQVAAGLAATGPALAGLTGVGSG